MINELALFCGKMGIDIWEVIEAAKTKPYGFMPFYPSPKIGGHCIPLDPFYLSYKAKEYNFWTRFIELAGEINEQMPHYVITRIISVLNKNRKSVKGSKILIWGVTYKKDIADPRESAAYEIIPELLKRGAKINYFDFFVPSFEIKDGQTGKYQILKSIKYSPNRLKDYDLVLILTDHSGFNYNELAKKAKLIVDTRNAIKSRKHKNVSWF
jgi:UDP-N-acetyl-D-glucosamine dehydrogenase